MLIESGHDRIFQVVWQDVLGANLKHTRAYFVRQRQHGAVVQIVGEHDVLLSNCPIHDVPVVGPWVADERPVHRLPSMLLQHR